MKKYVILCIAFLLVATAIIVGKQMKQNTHFQYSALGKTFQCSPTKNEQEWSCTSPDEPKKGRFTAVIWNISQQEQDRNTPAPENSSEPWLTDVKLLTVHKAAKRVRDTFTNLFGKPTRETIHFCPQKNTLAGYAIAKSSTIEVNDKGRVLEVEVPIPAAEVFYKATPEKAVFILHQFDLELRNDMLRHPEKMTLENLQAFENLQSLWDQQLLSKLCELP